MSNVLVQVRPTDVGLGVNRRQIVSICIDASDTWMSVGTASGDIVTCSLGPKPVLRVRVFA